MDEQLVALAPNPSGAAPDFNTGHSLEAEVAITGVLSIIISATFVLLRLTTVFKKSGRLYADDYLCLAGEIGGIAQWALLYSIVRKGVGRHTWDVPVSAITPLAMQLQIASQLLSAVTHFVVKASILALYLRLFGTLQWVRLTCYGLLSFTLLTYISYDIVALVFCVPNGVGEAWDLNLLAKCAKTASGAIAVGVCSVLADIAIFLVPFPVISKLNLDSQKRWGLAVVFLVGFLIVVTSVVNLAYRTIIARGTDDPVWNGVNVAITSFMEVFGTVIVSCAPAISAFWKSIITKSDLYANLRTVLRSRRHHRRVVATTKKTGGSPGRCTKCGQRCWNCVPLEQLYTTTSSHAELVDDIPGLGHTRPSGTVVAGRILRGGAGHGDRAARPTGASPPILEH